MIFLRDIDENNYEACSDLICTKEQCQFTNSPVWTLLQAAYSSLRNQSKLYSIYNDDTLVGLIRLDFTMHDNYYMFTNLLIDKKFQRKGYATGAVKCALNIFRNDGKHSLVKIHVAPENTSAIDLYKKVGFTLTEEFTENGLQVMFYKLYYSTQQ